MDADDHRFTIDPPELVDPELIVMLDGWIDASGVAAAAMAALVEDTDARELVTFDDDRYIDYRARRPTWELRQSVTTRLVWESPRLLWGQDRNGKDLLLLTGPEPDMAWHRFCATVAQLSTQLGVVAMTAFGAYPYATPHTRPINVTATSPSPDVVRQLGYATSSLDIPAGVATALEDTLFQHGLLTATLWVQVPHYVSALSYPAASVALLDALERARGIVTPARALRRDVAVQKERLDHLVASNDEHQHMVSRLEQLYDDGELTEGEGPPLELRSGDELAAEVEQFLRDNPPK